MARLGARGAFADLELGCFRRRSALELEPRSRGQRLNPGGGGPGGGGGGRSGGGAGPSAGAGSGLGGVGNCPNCVPSPDLDPCFGAACGIDELPYYIYPTGGGGGGGGGGGRFIQESSEAGSTSPGIGYTYGGPPPGSQVPGGSGGPIPPPPAPGPLSRLPSFFPPSRAAAGLGPFEGLEPLDKGFDLELLRRRPMAKPLPTQARAPSFGAGNEFRVPGGFQLPPEKEFARRLERPRYEIGKGEDSDPLIKFLRGLFGPGRT